MSNTTNLLPIAFKAVVKCKFNKLLICMAMLCASITATAYDFEVDGIYYNKLTNKTCEVTYETTSYKTYSGDIAIPQKVSFDGATYTVTSIGSSAFRYCSNLISIAFPSSLTSIGDLAFNSCTSLATVIIPNSVTAIRKYAFKGCTSLATVIIPNSITSIEDYVFEDCTSLVSVTIPSSVTSIGTAVFMGCISIKNINIPNSVTSIGSAAFSGCTSLTSITIPNSVTSIAVSAFNNCVSLKIVNISDLTAWCTIDFLGPNSNPLCYAKCLYLNDKLVTDLVIPDGVTKINRYAFYSAECLSSITICNPLITIGKDAFYGCSNLGDVRISDLAAWCNIDFSNLESNPLAYAKLLYLNNELVTNLVIPNTVSKIKSYSFYNCKCLTSVIIPNTVTSLDNKAFYGCSGLTSVTIPNSVISIGESTFRDCTELTSVTIPNSVTSIGSSAFKGCLDRG